MENFLEVKNIDVAEAMLRGIPNGIERAITSSINRTLAKVKTDMKKKTTSDYNIKASEIENKLSVYKANFSNLRGTIYAKTPRLALSKFITSSDKGNIKVRVKKNESSKKVMGKPRLYSKPFTAVMKSGHLGIFQRIGVKKLPISQLYTIGIAEMLGSQSVTEFTVEQGNIYLENYFEREVNRILKGYL